jgi:hypothetical protein
MFAEIAVAAPHSGYFPPGAPGTCQSVSLKSSRPHRVKSHPASDHKAWSCVGPRAHSGRVPPHTPSGRLPSADLRPPLSAENTHADLASRQHRLTLSPVLLTRHGFKLTSSRANATRSQNKCRTASLSPLSSLLGGHTDAASIGSWRKLRFGMSRHEGDIRVRHMPDHARKTVASLWRSAWAQVAGSEKCRRNYAKPPLDLKSVDLGLG